MFTVKRFQRTLATTAAVAAAVGMLGACSPDQSGAARPAAQETTAVSAPVESEIAGQAPAPAKTQGWLKIFAGAAPRGVAAVQLTLTENPAVGKYVSDGSGRSLYRFDKDTAHP